MTYMTVVTLMFSIIFLTTGEFILKQICLTDPTFYWKAALNISADLAGLLERRNHQSGKTDPKNQETSKNEFGKSAP